MHFLVMACLFVGCAMTACSDDDDTDDVIPSDDTSYVGKSVGNFTAEEWYVGGLKGTTMNVTQGCYEDERNLITNAVKYSYANSVIKLEFDTEGVYYSIIRVTDNGIGMSKDELKDLFQIDKLNTRPGTNREAGNGLGLIICHDFIEKHGGTITVETEEDFGTTFVVKIPYARYINKVNA